MTDLEKKVMQAIEKQNLAPKPYAYFLAKRSVFWALAIASILLGAVSAATAMFAIQDMIQNGGRQFTDMPFDDVFQSLPALWLLFFILFCLSAYFGLRRTRRGYRYRPLGIAALIVLASLGLGWLLHVAEAGSSLHNFLAARLPSYADYTHVPYAEWSRPDKGTLGGEVQSVEAGKSLVLKDFSGKQWNVDISTAINNVKNQDLIKEDVAIRGERTGPFSFKANSMEDFD
jgi:hypothetical protein